MKTKTERSKELSLKIIIASLLAVVTLLGGVATSKGVGCDKIDDAFARYDMTHPEVAKCIQQTPQTAATTYAIAMQFAVQLNGGSTQGIVVAVDQNTYVKQTLQKQAADYTGYIKALQVQYQNDIAAGNLEHAQQCVNLCNQWGPMLAQTNAQLAALP